MDPSPEQWKYDAGAPLKSPRSPRGDTEPPAPNAPGSAVPTSMKYKPVGTPSSHRIHGAAIYTMGNIFIYGNMDPINIP